MTNLNITPPHHWISRMEHVTRSFHIIMNKYSVRLITVNQKCDHMVIHAVIGFVICK